MAKPFGTAIRKRCSSTSTSCVSRSHVSKFAGDSETWSSPRAARQTCFASIRSMVTLVQCGWSIGSGGCGAGGRGSQGRRSVFGRPSGEPDDALPMPRSEVAEALPRASRRRGPGEDSTGADGRRKAIPAYSLGSIRAELVAAGGRAASHRLGSAARCGPVGRPRLTPLPGASYHPPDDERAMRSVGRRRVCVPLGVTERPPRGRTERIADSPDEADLPAQEAPSRQGARLPRPDEDDRGSPHPRRSAGSRSEAADGLTTERGTHPPRLVMLSRPQDFAAIQGAGTDRSHPLLSARFLRTDLETTRFGLSTGRRSAARSSGTGSAADSARRSG